MNQVEPTGLCRPWEGILVRREVFQMEFTHERCFGQPGQGQPLEVFPVFGLTHQFLCLRIKVYLYGLVSPGFT